MASRARGRGRGLASEAVKQPTSSKKQSPRTPRSIEELGEYLYSLNEGNIGIHGTEFADMVLRFADSNEKLASAVDLIFDTTVESRDHSELGSTVCRLIVERGTDGNTSAVSSGFKQKLLKRFQSEMKSSQEIRKKSIEQWLGIFAFLCDVYRKIKAAGGKPISVVGKSILTNVQTMLTNPDTIDDEIETVCSKLKKCGETLEKEDAAVMEGVIVALRKEVISSKSSCQRRCFAMELIEYRQLGWKDTSGKLDDFYIDAITDAIVEDEVGKN